MERRKLPTDRKALVHKMSVGDTKGYLRVGLFEDGTPGEIFINMGKSQDAGPWGCIGILISMALQRGVPLQDIVRKLSHTQFEPRGAIKEDLPTNLDPNAPTSRMVSSVADYVARWLWKEFGGKE